jgi:RNA polymerase sigma-70 factor (ECF subfamily)
LLSLRHAENEAAWQQFVTIYLPLVFSFCVKRGLQEADAADVGQEVLRAVASGIGHFHYDPERGTFRAWLLQITRNKLNRFFTRRYRDAQPAGDTAIARFTEGTSGPDEQAVWEEDYQQRLFDWAVGCIRGEFQNITWQAFWLTAVQEVSVKETAAQLGISIGAVYIARSRVLARLRAKVEAVTGEPWNEPKPAR